MKVDYWTKSVLAVIAIALWMIALNPWLKPAPVAAQARLDLEDSQKLSDIRDSLRTMTRTLDVIDHETQSISVALAGIAANTAPRITMPRR